MDIDWGEYTEFITRARNGENILTEEDIRERKQELKKAEKNRREIERRRRMKTENPEKYEAMLERQRLYRKRKKLKNA